MAAFGAGMCGGWCPCSEHPRRPPGGPLRTIPPALGWLLYPTFKSSFNGSSVVCALGRTWGLMGGIGCGGSGAGGACSRADSE